MNLTPKQEKFVQGIMSGLSQRAAYKQAYDCKNMADNSIDVNAAKLFKNAKVVLRYNQLLDEHKSKSLWTREEAVNDLKWLKEQAKADIQSIGVKQANSNAFINAVKELNTIEDLYPKYKQEDSEQEKDVAAALRGLVDGINSKAD